MTSTTLSRRRIGAIEAPNWTVKAEAWLREHGPGLAILSVLLLFAGVLHGWNMYQSPGTTATDDEGTYVAQAWALLHQGELANYTYWYDHPPVGWILLAGYAWMTDAFDRLPVAIMVGREFMLVMKLASAALLYGLARRLGFHRAFAALAVVLFAVNPLALFFQRLTFLDNIAVPWMLAALFLAASPQKRLSAHTAGAVCLAVAILTKETLALLLPAYLYLLWQHSGRGTRGYTFFVSGLLFVSTGLLYPLFATLKGELLPGEDHVSLWGALRWQLFDRVSSGSIFDPYSPASGFVRLWAGLDLWMMALAAIALPAAFFRPWLRPIAAALLIQAVMPLRSSGYLPLPYLVAVLPFAALMIAGAFDSLWRIRDVIAAKCETLPSFDRSGRLVRILSVSLIVNVLLIFGVGVVVPKWVPQVEAFTTEQQNIAHQQATNWVADNISRDQFLLVGHAYWVDLVNRGFSTEKVIWYYKPDTDPEVSARLPNAWQDIGYIVSNVEMRATVDALKGQEDGAMIATTIEAFEHSTPVASFGEDGAEIIVHKVDPTMP